MCLYVSAPEFAGNNKKVALYEENTMEGLNKPSPKTSVTKRPLVMDDELEQTQ